MFTVYHANERAHKCLCDVLYHKTDPQRDPTLAPPRTELQLPRSKTTAISVVASLFLRCEKINYEPLLDIQTSSLTEMIILASK